MFKKFIFVIGLLVSGSASASVVKTCIPSVNYCQYTELLDNTVRTYIPQAMWNAMGLDARRDMKNTLGVGYNYFDASNQRNLELQVTRVEEYSEVALNDLFKMGPDERGVVDEFFDCAGSLASCGGAGAAGSYFGPLGAYLAAKGLCANAGYQCATAYMSYTEWKKSETERRKAEGESNKPTASYGHEGPGAVMPTGRGHPIRVVQKCETIRGGTVVAGGVTSHVTPMRVCKNVVQ